MALLDVLKTTRDYDYSDLDLDFIAHPATGDITIKYGVEALKRSIKNLVFTNFYDRPFNPQIGCNARKLLFENITPLTANFLTDHITNVLVNFEPRVNILDVQVQMNTDENGYNAVITFTPINVPEPQVVGIFLKQIR